jgi:organic hydroperoxide reductase OsmC/OhrA
LHPLVTITDGDQSGLADRLHEDASQDCFIANSLNLPVDHQPRTVVKRR